ncbi:recombinase family protein [Cytobacillus sp. FJAT-54145]|uniref:Recombinase family protein n=1 Tax=Cytobacillus spartinae TaxID=3299023 RepID=A0ABW6KMD7_9BACI
MHKYCYQHNGVCFLTEEPLPNFEVAKKPWNIYRDSIKLLTAYIRWSDEKQTSGHSLNTQLLEILARTKIEGYNAIVIFIDKATSAFHVPAQKREKMLEMKSFILSNKNAIGTIFFDESRQTRLIEDYVLNILRPIKDFKPNFKVYSTKIDGEWDENNLQVQVRLSFAHDESVEKSTKAYDFHNILTKNKPKPQRPPSRNPLGYSLTIEEPDKFETNDFVFIVLLIFYLYSYGYSEDKIADFLNKAKIPTPSQDAKEWWDSSIRYILNNYWYSGDLAWFARTSFENSKRRPEGEFFLEPNHHEPLIGMNLWNTTRYLREYKKNKEQMNSPFILRNIAICSSCNTKLTTKNSTPVKSKKKYMYYRCPSCKQKLNMDDLNEVIVNDLSKRWSKELNQHLKEIEKILMSWNKVLRKKITETKDSISKLKYKFSMLDQSQAFFKDVKESFELQIRFFEKNNTELNTALEQIKALQDDEKQIELIDRFKQSIHEYSLEEKRYIILLAVESVEVDFNRKNHIKIEYRLTPYIDLENLVNSINESA